MKKVLFTGRSLTPLTEDEIASLKLQGIQIIREEKVLSEKELIKKLQGCQGYVIGGPDKATKKVIESTELEIIVFHGTGYENSIDVEAAKVNGIAVANCPGANAYTVAEHTVALILDAVKNITNLNNQVKSALWQRRQTWNLENKTLGIIGLGTIGQHVATIMKNAFKMRLLYVSRTAKPEAEKKLKVTKVDLAELMAKSDVVSIHASYSHEAAKMIGAKELKLMQPHAVLVCTARAELVDGKALVQALKQGKLAAAAFDGYYQEPTPNKQDDKWGLLSLPDDKFIITPHTAYNSQEALKQMNQMVIDNLTAFFKGKKPPYLVE